MNVFLNANDCERLERLVRVRNDNFEYLARLADFLNYSPRLITVDDVRTLSDDAKLSRERAFSFLLAAAYGLDDQSGPDDQRLIREYVFPSVKQLETTVYRADSWFQAVRSTTFTSGSWEFCQQSYQPYEAFVRGDLTRTAEFREIPSVGFFDEEFSFPALLQDGREWMTVTPNEIETMRDALDAASGRVLTFGLGLGYFAFHAAQKKETSQVVIVERDARLIELFQKYLLPSIENREKIRIIERDAFDYAESQLPQEKFDLSFVDLWHDISDGTPLYVRMKKRERRTDERTSWFYWIEPELLSNLRWRLFDATVAAFQTGQIPDSIVIPGDSGDLGRSGDLNGADDGAILRLPFDRFPSFEDVQKALSDSFLKRWTQEQ